MNTGLLSGTDTDGLSALDIAYRVGLGIFQGDEGDFHIHQRLSRNLFLLCYDIGEKVTVHVELIAALFKSNAEDLLFLQGIWYVGRVDLDDIVVAFFLLFQNFKCFFCISWSNDTVGNLAFDELCGIRVADVGQCDEITKGRHSVSASCSCISTCQRGELAEIINPVDFCECIGQWKTHCSSCRGYMLERSGSRKTGSFF